MNETTKQAARRLSKQWIAKGYKPRALHEYRDAGGNVIYWRIRLEHPGGDAAPEGRKIVRPMKLNGSGYTLGEPDFPGGKPLYNLHLLAADPTARVWIVEGEKAADALTKLGAVATTSGGADSAERANWLPLRGRKCCLWGDNDAAGAEYVSRVAAILSRLDCRLTTVDVQRLSLPEKGDAWDWLEAHQSAVLADLEALPMLDTSEPLSDGMAADCCAPVVRLIRGDSITPEAVRWIWDGWLAAGKFHVLAGRPGAGKTTLALALAAIITSGGRWPDGSRAEPGNVLIWSGEDDPKDTLVPRLIANGANRSRVFFVGESIGSDGTPISFDPARHMTALELEAARIGGVRLLIVDPVVSAVIGDGNSNTEVRRSLQPLVDLAARVDCAALGNSHFTKGSDGRDVVERVTGSLAFGAAARVVLVAAKLKGENDQTAGRIVARAKSNIGPDSGGFGYELRQVELPDYPSVLASRVQWSGAIEGTARELLQQAEGDDEGDGGNPRQFLAELLAGGPMNAPQVFRDAEAHGYSKRQMQRACKRLGIKPKKVGMFGGWKWALPEDDGQSGDDGEDVEGSAFSRVASSAPLASTFVGEDTGMDPNTPEDSGLDKAAPSAPSARDWRITRKNGESFEVRTVPRATLAEMIERYPDAAVEPLPDSGHSVA
jgi:hypothetical protein